MVTLLTVITQPPLPYPLRILGEIIDSLSSLSFLYWLIGLALAIIVYQDAKKRQNSLALLWAIGVFLFWSPGIILYFIFRGAEPEEELQGGPMKRFKRTYFFLIAFVSLSVLFWGLADLGRVILEFFLGRPSGDYYGRVYLLDTFKRDVSFRLSSIIVALPLWVFHWAKAIEEPTEGDITHKYYDAIDRRNYSLLVLGVTGFIILITGIWLIHEVLNALLGVSNRQPEDFGTPLSYTVVSLVAWNYHFQIFKNVTKELKEFRLKLSDVGKTQTKAAYTTKKSFCRQCGEKLNPQAKFCSGCGAKIG